MIEEFQSKMGRITVQTMPYCEGCQDFNPYADQNILTGDGGKCYRDEHGRCVVTGVHISCKHMFRCQAMYRDLKERMMKGELDGSAQTQPDSDCCEERRTTAEKAEDVQT